MTAWGQTRSFGDVGSMSALPPKADVDQRAQVPKAAVRALARCGRPSKTTLIRPDVTRNLSSANGCTCTSALPPASSLTENDVETGYVRIIGAGEDERLPTPISTHASMRWKVFCSVNKIVSGRPFPPL